MSWLPCPDPMPGDAGAADSIETVVVPRTRDLGGFEVRRALPSRKRGLVGPFIFFDQMGPAEFLLHEGIDIKPHPHINLATVTYLFDGEITHRDSLGNEQVIRPGAVNLMTAGQGITHSERSGAEVRQTPGSRLFGLQLWTAMPARFEESEPTFAHTPATALPVFEDTGVWARLVMGNAWGQQSSVDTLSDTLYADVTLDRHGALPVDTDHEERAIYIVEGEITVGEEQFAAGQLVILRPDCPATVTNNSFVPARFVLIGGETMDGPRYIWWNFVSSRSDRIEQAKADWQAGRFDSVPGDIEDYIPLPDALGRPARYG